MELEQELNDLVTPTPPAEEPPLAEPPAAAAPSAEPPVVEPPKGGEPPAAEPPAVEPPAVEPPAAGAPPAGAPPAAEPSKEKTDAEKLTEALATIEALRSQVAAAAGGPQVPTPKPPTPEEIEAQRQAAAQKGPMIIPFLKNEQEVDETFRTHEGINKLLSSVVGTAVQYVYQSLPRAATELVNNQVTLRLAVNEFYRENKDLAQFKPFVGLVTNELVAQNPDWPLDKVMEETSKEVRKRLNLLKAAGVDPGSPAPPAGGGAAPGGDPPAGPGPGLPGAGGGGRRGGGAPAVSALQAEINELL